MGANFKKKKKKKKGSIRLLLHPGLFRKDQKIIKRRSVRVLLYYGTRVVALQLTDIITTHGLGPLSYHYSLGIPHQ